MYWIEVYFSNGKTLRKESNSINDTLVVYDRYCCRSVKKTQVQRVVAGRDDQTTFDCNHFKNIAL